MLSAPINLSIHGDGVIVPPSPGNVIRVTGYVLSGQGHNLLSWYSASSQGKLLGCAVLALISGLEDILGLPATVSAPLAPRSDWGQLGWFDTNPGEGLVLNLSDDNQVSGHVSYVILSPNALG